MSILDSNREYYFLKWIIKFTDVQITDESGNIIGEIKHPGRFIDEWKLLDNNNSIILTTYDPPWRNKITIKNVDKNVIGFVNYKLLSLKQKMVLKNEDKEVVLTQQMTKGSNFEIINPQGKKVAESTNEKGDRFFCILKILDQTFDRKLLLGFFIAIIASLFIPYGGEDGATAG